MRAIDEVLRANERYAASFGERGRLPSAPARRLAILTCMDARLDPAAFAGLADGDAHVIRNAGGRASDDAIRSLIVSYKLLGTEEWLVVHHTECGMEAITGEQMGELLASSLDTAELTEDGFVDVGTTPGSPAGRAIDWLTIDDAKQAVVDDVRRIREHPLVPARIRVHGLLYDVRSGRLAAVPTGDAHGIVPAQ